MSDQQALITPSVLRWARRQSGLTIPAAAAKIGLSPVYLLAWERGQGRPTIDEMRALAEVYNRPLAIFYYPYPPTRFWRLVNWLRGGQP